MRVEHRMPVGDMAHMEDAQCPCHPLVTEILADDRVVSRTVHHRSMEPSGGDEE